MNDWGGGGQEARQRLTSSSAIDDQGVLAIDLAYLQVKLPMRVKMKFTSSKSISRSLFYRV